MLCKGPEMCTYEVARSEESVNDACACIAGSTEDEDEGLVVGHIVCGVSSLYVSVSSLSSFILHSTSDSEIHGKQHHWVPVSRCTLLHHIPP